MNYFLPVAKITRDQGKVFRFGKRLLVPLFHPAAALRSTETLNVLTASFQKLPKIIEKYESLVTPPARISSQNTGNQENQFFQETLF